MPLTRAEAIDASFPQASDIRKHRAGTNPREGVYPDPTTVAAAGIAYAGSGWNIGARAFVAEIKRGGAPYTQAYGSTPISNDSNVAAAWTIASAPASGARIDLLCVRARDTTQGDSSSGAPTDGPSGAARTGFPEFLVVTGTAGTTPARPALPAGYEEIAQIQTPSGAASAAGSTITQTYTFAQSVGGTIYVRTEAERDALVNVLPGDDVFVTGTDTLFIRTAAGGWTRVKPGANLLASAAFSGTNVVPIDVFSTAFDKYTIEIDIDSTVDAGGISAIYARLRSAGVAEVGTGYYSQFVSGDGGTPAAAAQNAQTLWQLTGREGDVANIVMDISSPASPRRTTGLVRSFGWNTQTGPSMAVSLIGIAHGSTSIYDGILFTTINGQKIAGRYRVYGHAAA